MQPDFSQIGPFLLAALVVFVVYRRLRRSFGQQPLLPARMYVRIGTLAVVGCLLLPIASRSLPFASAAFAGAASGVLLAVWGAARTRFVRSGAQLYYVPHTYTGIAVSLLFLGRLAYRLIQVYGEMHAAHLSAAGSAGAASTPAGMLSSPLTLGLYFVLMGYYVCYYGLVLRLSKRGTAAEVVETTPLSQDDQHRVRHQQERDQ